MVKKQILIVGGGMAGCASAHVLSKFKDFKITLIDKMPFLGAGVRTSWFAGHPLYICPRHILTQKFRGLLFLDKINPLRKMDMTYLSFVEMTINFIIFLCILTI